jgi:hypothetical protein
MKAKLVLMKREEADAALVGDGGDEGAAEAEEDDQRGERGQRVEHREFGDGAAAKLDAPDVVDRCPRG